MPYDENRDDPINGLGDEIVPERGLPFEVFEEDAPSITLDDIDKPREVTDEELALLMGLPDEDDKPSKERDKGMGAVEPILRDGEISDVGVTSVGGVVSVTQLLEHNLISEGETAQAAGVTVGSMAQQGGTQLIVLDSSELGGREEEPYNPLIIFGSGMAVFFLMYTVTIGGRSILHERNIGTLSRMMATPTRVWQILGGKVLGIFLTGFLQVSVLILATSLLLDISWGDPVGVAGLIAATALAATGWGILLAALATTPGQVVALGVALMLIFGILGGSFAGVPDSGLWNTISKITPHAWAIDGIEKLASGGQAVDVITHILVMLSMTAVLFVIAIVAFQRTQRRGN